MKSTYIIRFALPGLLLASSSLFACKSEERRESTDAQQTEQTPTTGTATDSAGGELSVTDRATGGVKGMGDATRSTADRTTQVGREAAESVTGTAGEATDTRAQGDTATTGTSATDTDDTATQTGTTGAASPAAVEEDATEPPAYSTPQQQETTGSTTTEPRSEGEAGANVATPEASTSAMVPLEQLNEPHVRQLQDSLRRAGSSLNVDGVVGPETETALKDFQAKHDLEAHGQLDSDTIDQLGLPADEIMQAH